MCRLAPRGASTFEPAKGGRYRRMMMDVAGWDSRTTCTAFMSIEVF